MNLEELAGGIVDGLHNWLAYTDEAIIEEPEGNPDDGKLTILVSFEGKEIQITVEELDHQSQG